MLISIPDGGVDTASKKHARPKQIWLLTPKKGTTFSDAHADLTTGLIDMICETLGQSAVDDVIGSHEKEILARYPEEIKETDSLEDRVAEPAKIRS